MQGEMAMTIFVSLFIFSLFILFLFIIYYIIILYVIFVHIYNFVLKKFFTFSVYKYYYFVIICRPDIDRPFLRPEHVATQTNECRAYCGNFKAQT